MTLEFRTHRLWDSYTTVHLRVALVVAALLIAPVVTGAKPWQSDCSSTGAPAPRVEAQEADISPER